MKLSTILGAAAFAATAAAGAPKQKASTEPVLGTVTSVGCFSDMGDMVAQQKFSFEGQGHCAQVCNNIAGKKYTVAALKGSSCYCGTSYPAKSTLVDDSKCNIACPGYAMEACGGVSAYSIINIGITEDVPYAKGSADKGSAAETSVAATQPTATTAAGKASDKKNKDKAQKTLAVPAKASGTAAAVAASGTPVASSGASATSHKDAASTPKSSAKPKTDNSGSSGFDYVGIRSSVLGLAVVAIAGMVWL